MPDQTTRELVTRMVEAGDSDEQINEVLDERQRRQAAAPQRPEEILAASDPNYIPRAEQDALGPRALDRAPAIGSGVGATLGGIPGAAGGGFLGGLVRGDSLADAGMEGVKQGALQGAGGIIGRGVVGAGKWIASKADPLIQSAVKPALTELRSIAGRAGTSMAGEAKRVSGLIRRTGIRTPEAAEVGIKAAEGRVQQALQQTTPTDAPQRALSYLGQLKGRAARQMSPGDDVATLASERAALVKDSPLFKTVTTQRPKQVPSSILDASGRPITRTQMQNVSKRVPRTDVMADEALELARGTGRYATKKSYGEIKSTSVEAQKMFDRAGRDAAKAVTPKLRAALDEEGELIRLKPMLDRMMVREGGRDALSLPGIVGAAPAVAQGKIPIAGMAAQWLRNNQLRAGLAADKTGAALQRSGRATGEISPQVYRLLDILMRGRSSNEAP